MDNPTVVETPISTELDAEPVVRPLAEDKADTPDKPGHMVEAADLRSLARLVIERDAVRDGRRDSPSSDCLTAQALPMRFLVQWRQKAAALGWAAKDLFGLAEVPDRPAPNYRRLSRYDQTGLIWLLPRRRVVPLTHDTAVIENVTGTVSYHRHNKPALGRWRSLRRFPSITGVSNGRR